MYTDGGPSDKMVIMQISTNIKYFCMVLFKLNGEIGALLLGNLKGSATGYIRPPVDLQVDQVKWGGYDCLGWYNLPPSLKSA